MTPQDQRKKELKDMLRADRGCERIVAMYRDQCIHVNQDVPAGTTFGIMIEKILEAEYGPASANCGEIEISLGSSR